MKSARVVALRAITLVGFQISNKVTMNMTFRIVNLQLHRRKKVSAKGYRERRDAFGVVGTSVLLHTGCIPLLCY